MDRMAVGVLGAGTIGIGWAAVAVAHGVDARLWDPAPGAAERALACLGPLVADARRAGGVAAAPGEATVANNVGEAVHGVALVQENGPEDLTVKRSTFQKVEEAAPPGAVIASSSSTLTATEMQAGLARPGRVIVGHPFNPPHLIPLVEVIPGSATHPEAVERAVAIYRAMGRSTVALRREVPGHVANRLQAALWREAVNLMLEGVTDAADIDLVVTESIGLRWSVAGPNATFHMAGGADGMTHFLEHLGSAFQAVWDDLGTPRLDGPTRERIVQLTSVLGDTGILARKRDDALVAFLKARCMPRR